MTNWLVPALWHSVTSPHPPLLKNMATPLFFITPRENSAVSFNWNSQLLDANFTRNLCCCSSWHMKSSIQVQLMNTIQNYWIKQYTSLTTLSKVNIPLILLWYVREYFLHLVVSAILAGTMVLPLYGEQSKMRELVTGCEASQKLGAWSLALNLVT